MSSTCLLQVLDDGRLTDSKGRTVDFKNTVLIMTSNTGADKLTSAWAQGEDGFEEAKERVIDALKQTFRPEFLNRVDDIVVFHPLDDKELTHIVDLRLKDLEKLLADRRITLELTEAARKAIFKAGYDRAYGARPLKRAIQRTGAGQAGGEDPRRNRAARRPRGRRRGQGRTCIQSERACGCLRRRCSAERKKDRLRPVLFLAGQKGRGFSVR